MLCNIIAMSVNNNLAMSFEPSFIMIKNRSLNYLNVYRPSMSELLVSVSFYLNYFSFSFPSLSL